MARVADGDQDDDELRRALAYLYRHPDALEGPARAMVLSARAGAGPDLDEPGGEPDADDVERKVAEALKSGPRGPGGPTVAGLVLLAADTGRVLMLQRSYDDPDDPARGSWEFPGGHLEPGDATSLHGAMREWSEEVGRKVPAGGVPGHSWVSPNGVYAGHVLTIPAEDALDLSAKREVDNPDDDSEQVAWWTITHAMRNPALRRECQRTPWNAIKRTLAEARKTMKVEEKTVQVDEIEFKRPGDRDDDGVPDGKDPSPGGSPPGPAKADQGKGGKRHVASEAGSKRYGLPIGAEIGKARDKDAQKAQDDPHAKAAYEKLLTANPRDYRKMLDDMKEGDLQALSRVAYSFKSSNPQVVQARLALASALRRRGMDVNDFGGLGKRTGGKAPASGEAGSSRARSGAGSRSSGVTRKAEKNEDPSWVAGEDWQTRRARRTKLGLMGRSVPPTAKNKRGEGGQLMSLHIYEDGSWQYKGLAGDAEVVETADGGWVFVEAKAALPADPWQAALRSVELKRAAAKADGDGAAIKTIGDLAAAIKRAKGIEDEEKRDAARARIRKAAAALKATNMLPKDWSGGDGDGDDTGKSKPPWVKAGVPADLDTADPVVLAAYIEAKAMSADPSAAKLREYWAHGPGTKKWRPGTPGDFDRLRKHLRKYVPAHMLNGLVANIHKLATGEWPGKQAHGGKGLDDALDVEAKGGDAVAVLSPDMLADAAALDPTALDMAGDDDAISLALNRYSDMADELTTEEEYEAAIAREVDWDLLPDGTLERADGQDGHQVLDDAKLGEDVPDGPSGDPDDALAGLEEMLAG